MKIGSSRKKSYRSLKHQLDKVFSHYVRWKNLDIDGNATCVACGAKNKPERMHAAHWISRVYLATRWHESNVAVCCPTCNVLRRGNYSAYALYMVRHWGTLVMQELEEMKHISIKFTRAELQEKIDLYKGKISVLELSK